MSRRARLMLIIGIVGALGFCAVAITAAAQEPPGGTIPPVAGIACIPLAPTHDISGCDDKAFLPWISGGAK